MLVSPEFLRFAHTQNTYQLSRLLCSRDYHSIITRCQYADPNYGTCWFKAKIFPVGTAEDVMVRAMKYTAREIAWHSDLYYDAMLKSATSARHADSKRAFKKERGSYLSEEEVDNLLRTFLRGSSAQLGSGGRSSLENPSFHLYTYAFQPDQMYCSHDSLSTEKKMIQLFGSSQIEA